MSKMTVQQLIGIYEDLDNAIFSDGAGEFLMNSGYTPGKWQANANLFLDSYQKIIDSNTEAAKYDYFLREKEVESEAVYKNVCWSRVKKKTKESNMQDLGGDRPSEPFEGYFELLHKMSIPIEVLKKISKHTEPSPSLPMGTENIKRIGEFDFVLDEEKVIMVKSKETVIKLTPKQRRIFFGVMQKCFGNNQVISMEEIRNFCQNKTDGEGYIRNIISVINKAARNALNKDKKSNLIVSSPEDGPRLFKINHKFFTE